MPSSSTKHSRLNPSEQQIQRLYNFAPELISCVVKVLSAIRRGGGGLRVHEILRFLPPQWALHWNG